MKSCGNKAPRDGINFENYLISAIVISTQLRELKRGIHLNEIWKLIPFFNFIILLIIIALPNRSLL